MSIKNPSRREKKVYKKLSKCPSCGSKDVKRLGGSWCSLTQWSKSSGGITIRIEFCLRCPFVRKLYRIYPEMKERDWKEFK
jgi:ribosomal protein L37AE/L43A